MFFSTGRGTPAGFPVMPVIKVASNSRLFQTMGDDIDVNAGVLIEGRSLPELRAQMTELMIRVINGEKTKAEANGMDVFTFMTVNPPF
jgi:altronate dehydratase large subunit